MEVIVNVVVLSTERAYPGVPDAKKKFTRMAVTPRVWGRARFATRGIEHSSLMRAGEGNRTLVSSLGSWRSAIELHPQEEKEES